MMKHTFLGGVLVLSALSFAGCQSITSTDTNTTGSPILPSAASLATEDGMVLVTEGANSPGIGVEANTCADVTASRTLVNLFVSDEVKLSLLILRAAAGEHADHPESDLWVWNVRTAMVTGGSLQTYKATVKAKHTEVGWGYTILVTGHLRGQSLTDFRLMTGSANIGGTAGSWIVRDVRFTDDRTLVTVNWNRTTGNTQTDGQFTLSHELAAGSTMSSKRIDGTVTYDINLTGTVGGMSAGHYTISADLSTHAGYMTGPDNIKHCWNGSGECENCIT